MMTTQERSKSNRSWSGPRTLLTKEQAAEIYMIGRAFTDSGLDPLCGGRSALMAKKYGVSPKTIRDIWNRRTWQNETRHLWAKHDQPMIRYKKPVMLPGHPEFRPNGREMDHISERSCPTKQSSYFPFYDLVRSGPSTTWSSSSMADFAFCACPLSLQDIEHSVDSYELPPCAVRETPSLCALQPYGPADEKGHSQDVDEIPAAAWEGPFGPCLPPASENDADPFHADWPYW